MNIGELRERVTIEVLDTSSDGAGGTSGTWLVDSTVWAKVTPLTGRRLENYNQVFSGIPHEVIMRYNTGIDINNIQGFRITMDSNRIIRLASIVNVDYRDSVMIIIGEMGKPEEAVGVTFSATVTDTDGDHVLSNGGAYTCLPSDTTSLTADFSADDTTPTPGQEVQFTDGTTGGTPTAWVWDFGDGNTSYVQNPTHEYELPGIYTVKLTVYNSSEFGDSVTKTNYITIADNAAYFTERLTSQIQGDPSVYPPRDGGMLANVLGKPRHINGWNGSAPSLWGSVVTNQEQWESSDGGYTFSKIADTGAGRRHSQNYVDTGFEIAMWGGDLFDSPQTNKKDSWILNKTTGKWVKRATDMGSVWASRVLAASWYADGYYYSAGGQDDYLGTTMFTNVIRSADLTADSWSVVGTLPISYFSTGQVVYIKDGQYKGAAYLIGGFRYNNGGIGDNYNTGVYKTTDNGASWTLVATLPDSMRASYINCWYKDGRIFFLHGNYISTNQQGLYFITPSTLEGGGSWTSVYSTTFTNYNTIDARHATPHCEFHDVYGDHVMLGNGNLWADMWAVRKVEYPIGVGTTYDSDASTYLYRMYKISQQYADLVNNFITGCKADGNWTKIAMLYMFCVDGHFRNALVDMKTPTRVATNNGSVPWNAGRGFAPTGATGKSIRTAFNWTTDGGAAGITQNSLFHGVYLLTNSNTARTSAGAYETGGTKDCSLAPKWSDNNAYIGTAGNGSVVKANSRSDGFIMGLRTASNANELFRQNVSLGTSTLASQGLPNFEDYVCAVNNNGAAGSYDSRENAMRIIGLGTIDRTALYNRINTFMTGMGINITA